LTENLIRVAVQFLTRANAALPMSHNPAPLPTARALNFVSSIGGWIRRFLILLSVVIALAACTGDATAPGVVRSHAPAHAAGVAEQPGELDALLARVFGAAHIPGGAAVVIRGNRIVARGTAGVRKVGSNEPITPADQFEICSCAKAMTATLLARYVDDGRVTWDTSLADVFSDTVPRIHPAWKTVTLRQVMEHRAGLRDHFLLLARTTALSHQNPVEARRTLVAKILSKAPDTPPGQKFAYESAGYVILGAVVETVGGKPFETLMRERLFEPLGLTSAGFGPPGTPGEVDQPWGHGPRWFLYMPVPGSSCVPYDPGARHADFPAAASPAGLVHLSLDDWARFVALHLLGDPANPDRQVTLLRPETYAKLHGDGVVGQYGGGWFTGTRPWAKGGRPGDTGRVLFHEGDNGRWTCVVWVAPEINFTILIACNRGGMSAAIDEIAGRLVTTYGAAGEYGEAVGQE
jgi:CubicO group peptidase (beta-lactamase class C family)